MKQASAASNRSGVQTKATRKVPPRLSRPERRRLIVDAAARLIATQGIAALTVERLAAEVGVTKPIIYDHFPNASSVVVALLDEGFPSAENNVDELMRSDLPLEERFRQVAHLAFDALGSDPALLTVITTPLGDPELEQRRLEERHKRMVHWAAWWEAELGLPRATAEAVVSMLLASVEDAGRQFVNGTAERSVLEPVVAGFVTALVTASVWEAKPPRPAATPTEPSKAKAPARARRSRK